MNIITNPCLWSFSFQRPSPNIYSTSLSNHKFDNCKYCLCQLFLALLLQRLAPVTTYLTYLFYCMDSLKRERSQRSEVTRISLISQVQKQGSPSIEVSLRITVLLFLITTSIDNLHSCPVFMSSHEPFLGRKHLIVSSGKMNQSRPVTWTSLKLQTQKIIFIDQDKRQGFS